jgi:phosphonate transport system permease protein
LGAFLVGLGAGIFWGLIAAAAVLGALHLAELDLSTWESALVAVGMVVSILLTRQMLTPVPEALTPAFALGLSLAWLPIGVTAGIVVARRRLVSSGINIALIWVGSGLLAVLLASALDTLDNGAPELTVGAAVTLSLVFTMLGGGATISGATGVRGLGIGSAVVIITWFAAIKVGLTIPGLVENIANIANFPNLWPPDFSWAVGGGTWWWLPSWEFGSPTLASPLIETFQIAVIASLIGCLVALPLSFLASQVTAPGRISYLLSKGFMNVTRTIPDLFWALIFVGGLGIGPLAGVLALFFFSLAIMSKLFSETIDSVDTGPLEAARASGGSHFPAVRVSVLPQVLPNYVAYALYIFELNIRASLVLGIVGAGGIGRVLEAQRRFFQFDRVFAVVIIIFVLVFIIEQISVALRRKLV